MNQISLDHFVLVLKVLNSILGGLDVVAEFVNLLVNHSLIIGKVDLFHLTLMDLILGEGLTLDLLQEFLDIHLFLIVNTVVDFSHMHSEFI